VNRIYLLAGAGAITVVSALALTYLFENKGPAQNKIVKTLVPLKVEKGSKNSQQPTSSIVKQLDVKKRLQPSKPAFDVVRVNPKGDAVIAGRAGPNSNVIIKSGRQVVGKVKSDGRGEWVFLPKKPLKPGGQELSLTSILPSGSEVSSDKNVVIVVPRNEKVVDVVKSKKSSNVLAILSPQKTLGPSVVIPNPNVGVAKNNSQKGSLTAIKLSIETIDYDDLGNVTVGGKTDPAATINLYIDNNLVGTDMSDDKGHWHVSPKEKLAPGIYSLRADMVDQNGKVISRVETRFARSGPIGKKPKIGMVNVKEGNSLWRIARRAYGKGMQYTIIYKANRDQIRDPDLIYPGQIFFIPKLN
jgi:hypothetical protein